MHATRKLRKLSTINRRFILSKTHLELHLLALFEGLCFKTNFARFILCHDSYEINIPKCHKVILYPYLTLTLLSSVTNDKGGGGKQCYAAKQGGGVVVVLL